MRQFVWLEHFAHDGLVLPSRQTDHSAGYDLAAGESVCLAAGEVRLVRTGLCVKLQSHEFLAIYARSSLALRRRVILANGVGVIDADYFGNPDNGGELFVALWNLSADNVMIERGERIAQGVFTTYLTTTSDQPLSERRQGGFGSTGAS